jgi:hypothetical protein
MNLSQLFAQFKLRLATVLYQPARLLHLAIAVLFLFCLFAPTKCGAQMNTAVKPLSREAPLPERLGLNRPFSRIAGDLIPVSFAAISGASLAFHETIVHKQSLFRNRFPDADPMIFDPSVSWRNKYYGHDPAQGRTKLPVQLTDAKHFSMTMTLAAMAGASVSIPIHRGQVKHKPLVIVRRAVLSYFAFALANDITRSYFGW